MHDLTMARPLAEHLQQHLQEASRLARSGALVVALGLLPALVWLVYAPLKSAVIAPAYVKVDLNRRAVQHVEGGVVREVHVRDGQVVTKGQTLMILGDVGVAADANRLDYRVEAERLGIVRLEAEESMRNSLSFPAAAVSKAGSDPRIAELISKERSLFQSRRDSMVTQIGLLRSQRDSVTVERRAMTAQITNTAESLSRQGAELVTVRDLHKDGFVSGARVNQLEASLSDYSARLEERRADLARADQRATEIELRIRTIENEYRQLASDQLKSAVARLSELEQEQRKSLDASHRQVIAAPASGTIMNLKFSTPGFVISPRENIADIVPETPQLVLEASIRPADIGRVLPGGPASIRFPAFKATLTSLVQGKVSYVSPDRTLDPSTRNASYGVLIEIDPASLSGAGIRQLQAGMPAEVYLDGEERSPMAYLLEPVTDLLRRSAREN